MEENAGEWVKAKDRDRAWAGRGRVEDRARVRADRVADALAVLLLEAQQAPACVRNAGIANRMNAECRVCRSSVRSAALR